MRMTEYFRRTHPLCAECEPEGRTKLGEEVHHKIAHRGNVELYADPDNWEHLCKAHHSALTQQGL